MAREGQGYPCYQHDMMMMMMKLCLKIDLVSYPAQAEGLEGGACGVMVIVIGNGYGDTSSNPGRD